MNPKIRVIFKNTNFVTIHIKNIIVCDFMYLDKVYASLTATIIKIYEHLTEKTIKSLVFPLHFPVLFLLKYHINYLHTVFTH